MPSSDLKTLRQQAAGGNNTALRFFLARVAAGRDWLALSGMVETLSGAGRGQEARFIEAQFNCCHGYPAPARWQDSLQALVAEGFRPAMLIAAMYHDWAGHHQGASALAARLNDVPTASDAGVFSDGWEQWTPPSWQHQHSADSVHIDLAEGFAPPGVLHYVLALLAPGLRPASVVHPETGQPVAHPVRRNSSVQWLPEQLGWPGKLLERRLAEAGAYDIAHGEVLNLLHYRPGERYKAHLDCLPRSQAMDETQGGQRRMTLLTGMGSDDYSGGETAFVKLGVALRIPQGGILRFNNVDGTGEPLAQTLHEGRPVIDGQKWILSKWVRSGPTPYGRELAPG